MLAGYHSRTEIDRRPHILTPKIEEKKLHASLHKMRQILILQR